MGKIDESFYRLASAQHLITKAEWAAFQTGELGRKKTIISVDNDEAIVMKWALEEYLTRKRRIINDLS